MKKLLSILLTACIMLSACFISGFSVNAEEFTEGGFKYTVANNEATITGTTSSTATSLIIPSTLGGYTVTSIGDSAFKGCTGLTNIKIPNSVTRIGGYAFYGCTGLTNIEIPNSVTRIGDSAFRGCTGLTNIETPNSVTSIGGAAFGGCTGLTNIEIPNSVTSIGGSAFEGCTGLTSVTIPESVVYIGSSAFWDCTAIKDVWYSCANGENLTIDIYNTNLQTAKWHLNTCAEHTYSGDCDTTCNNCEWVRTTQVEHSFDGECATTCDNCDYTRTVENGHSYTLNSGLTCSSCKNSKAPSAPSLINVTDSSVTLVAVTGCEYSKDGINWQSSNIFNNLNPNTSYTFYQRVAKSQTSNLGPSSAGATFTTTARLAGDLNGDSRVTLDDVVLLAQYVAGWNVTLN